LVCPYVAQQGRHQGLWRVLGSSYPPPISPALTRVGALAVAAATESSASPAGYVVSRTDLRITDGEVIVMSIYDSDDFLGPVCDAGFMAW
jgi:hypothetical protein